MSTSTSDPVISVQDTVLKAVKAGQARTVEATRVVTELVAPIVARLPKSPLAGMVPEPAAVIGSQLAFVDDLVAAHRDYTRKLVQVLAPPID